VKLIIVYDCYEFMLFYAIVITFNECQHQYCLFTFFSHDYVIFSALLPLLKTDLSLKDTAG